MFEIDLGHCWSQTILELEYGFKDVSYLSNEVHRLDLMQAATIDVQRNFERNTMVRDLHIFLLQSNCSNRSLPEDRFIELSENALRSFGLLEYTSTLWYKIKTRGFALTSIVPKGLH